MKRKAMLSGALILSVLYSFMLVGTIILAVSAVVYYFMGQSVQIINDLFLPLLNPFLVMGKVWMLVFVFLTIIACVFMLVLSTRFIKYSSAEKDMFLRKKSMMIFYLICLILAMGGYSYWFAYNLSKFTFNAKTLVNVVLIIIIALHLISAILICISMGKELTFSNQQITVQPVAPQSQNRPAIYTAGLEEQVEEQVETKTQETKKSPQHLEESLSSKKLIESIGKLEQMRKEGSISAVEYTQLRGQLIKKFTK
mgnify:FL=1